jgi:metallophosphoesterase (TIGR03767 family)
VHPLDRRAFLRNLGLAGAAVWAGPELVGRYRQALARTFATAASVGGTTLAVSIVPASSGAGYHRLTEGPGWPTVLRTMPGAQAASGREDRRVALAALVHLTDVHVVDAQSPARVEFLDRYADQPTNQIPFNAAQRAHETLTAHVSEAMVRRVNSLRGGPITGRPFDCAVSTGDNVDNTQHNELTWHIGLLDGGRAVTPNSGDPATYEGVQDDNVTIFDQHYWHPDATDPNSDFYKRYHGFPAYPGLLASAIKAFQAEGLRLPWYSCYGNHDGLLQGNAPTNAALNAIATGPLKVVDLPAGMSPGDLYNGLSKQDPTVIAALATAPARPVTADADRRIVGPSEYVQALQGSPGSPAGHGYHGVDPAGGLLYYTFTVAPGVTGIVLDTVNRGGYADGSIGSNQQSWLQQRLEEAKQAGTLVVLFSHHNLDTMQNPVPDPLGQPGADPQRILGSQIEALLHQYANVVLWVNGHSHVNRITPHPDTTGATQGFWEISTAAHVDFPQHARLIEVVDNRDGTLSIFGTLIDHAAPAATHVGAADVLGLAAISRELAANDYQWDGVAAVGAAGDRNVELVLKAPPVAVLGRATTGAGAAGSASSRGGALPATGANLAGPAALGAALLGGAVALRRRTEAAPAPANVDTERPEG